MQDPTHTVTTQPTIPPASAIPARLLIPIDATDASLWAVQHALQRARSEVVEVCLVGIVAPVRDWQALQFRTESEMGEFLRHRAEAFLQAAAQSFQQYGIPVRTFVREADTAAGIIDAAEELGCTEIVMRAPDWWERLTNGVGPKVRRSAGRLPVNFVGPDGKSES